MPPPGKGKAEKLGKRKGKTTTGSNITGAGSGAQKQLAEAEAAVTDRFGRVRQQKLQEEIARGPKIKGLTSASGPVRQRFETSPLGRLGIDPGLIGRSDLPTTNTQRTITASELANIGTERDRISNIRNKDARDLERLSQINRVLGLNRTSGMGIMDSLRQNFGGLQAQRDFANLGNTARGIFNALPTRRLLTGLLNKIPGVNLPMQVGMNPVNFNITPEMRSFEQFSPLLSEEEQEQFSSPFLNRILFGSPADRVFEGPASRDFRRDLQPFLNEEAIARAETDRGTNFYREFENYLQRNNFEPEDLGIQDDFLRRQTDFYNRPPVFGETSGDVRLMGNQGITDEGTAINQGDPIFNLMTNPALDIDGDGRISTTELYGVAQPEPETKFGLPFEAVEAVINDESQLGLNNLMQPIVRDFNQRPLVFDI